MHRTWFHIGFFCLALAANLSGTSAKPQSLEPAAKSDVSRKAARHEPKRPSYALVLGRRPQFLNAFFELAGLGQYDVYHHSIADTFNKSIPACSR